MTDPFISSDPNAWLRPHRQALHQQQSFFANLAPELQANALAHALEEDHPNQAAEVREWNTATRREMLAVLDQALNERHADRQTELWRMTKGSRELTCAAVYTRVGLDVRLFERGEMLRAELSHDCWFIAPGGFTAMQQALERTGWRETTAKEGLSASDTFPVLT